MRILSWNINGIKTLPHYHPWNTLKTGDAILKELGADVICFQEMKSSRANLERHVALPSAFDAFFSFPQLKGGYSGVAVYTARESVVPLKAEEGLSGTLSNVKPPLTAEERIHGYPSMDDLEHVLFPNEQGDKPDDFALLDSEGRALTLDFGLFVLINTYCPNETSNARLPFKMNYHLMLEDRVRRLRERGREVIVVGDINISAQPIDHCDGHLSSNRDAWFAHPAREWFRRWLQPVGPMADIIRQYHPNRTDMYTCWNMKIMARETNYGSRIDYILVTPGLLPWIKGGDIQPQLKGSDHCPIYIDLHDEITDDAGNIMRLKDKMQQGANKCVTPRLASKNWDEYSGKQKLLSNFFVKAKTKQAVAEASHPSSLAPVETVVSGNEAIAFGDLASGSELASSTQPVIDDRLATDELLADMTGLPTSLKFPTSLPSPQGTVESLRPTVKRRLSSENAIITLPNLDASDAYDAVLRKSKRAKSNRNVNKSATATKGKSTAKDGQQQLLSLFTTSASKGKRTEPFEVDEVIDITDTAESNGSSGTAVDATEDDDNSGLKRLSLSLSQSSDIPSVVSQKDSKAAWGTLFARAEPPRCTIHNEPTKQFTVNKAGPNKGRAFFVCSRPIGPGYDKGRGERLRTEVDPQYKCSFFVWASDVRRGNGSTSVSVDNLM